MSRFKVGDLVCFNGKEHQHQLDKIDRRCVEGVVACVAAVQDNGPIQVKRVSDNGLMLCFEESLTLVSDVASPFEVSFDANTLEGSEYVDYKAYIELPAMPNGQQRSLCLCLTANQHNDTRHAELTYEVDGNHDTVDTFGISTDYFDEITGYKARGKDEVSPALPVKKEETQMSEYKFVSQEEQRKAIIGDFVWMDGVERPGEVTSVDTNSDSKTLQVEFYDGSELAGLWFHPVITRLVPRVGDKVVITDSDSRDGHNLKIGSICKVKEVDASGRIVVRGKRRPDGKRITQYIRHGYTIIKRKYEGISHELNPKVKNNEPQG